MIDSAFLARLIARLSTRQTVLDDAEFAASTTQREAIKTALSVLASSEADALSDADAAASITTLAHAKTAITRLNQRQAKAFEALQRIIKYVAQK